MCKAALALLGVVTACGGDSGDAPPNDGYVSMYSATHTEASTPLSDGVAFAFFQTSTTAPCVPEPIGDCIFYACSGSGPTFHSGGTITVAGATTPVSLVPKADGTYESFRVSALFDGGETLTASGTGDDVPAFSASLTAPSRVTLTAPAAFTIDRAQPLHLAWTGSSEGEIEIELSGPDESTLACRYPAGDGAADIPAAALAKITAGDGELLANTIVEETVDAGDWRIHFDATYGTVLPDESLVSFVDATYQ